MPARVCLSDSGSDRATAYTTSSKIVRRGAHLFVGWLDAPQHQGGRTRAMLGVCDADTGALRHKLLLGETYDNHCGPALALDVRGRLHAILGAHGQAPRETSGQAHQQGGGAFVYRWSDEPCSAASWSTPEMLGPADTYPSLVVDAEGTLHLAHRDCGATREAHWQLWYRRKRPGQPWEGPRGLVESPAPGYCHFCHSLALGPAGQLHLLFQFHHGPTGRAQDCKTVGIAHLRSFDGGTTWLCDDRPLPRVPAQMDQLELIHQAPQGGLGISNLLVDDIGRPWFLAADPRAPTGLIWHHSVEGWQANALPRILPANGFQLGGGSLSRDPEGHLHAVVAAPPDGRTVGFFDPSLEVCHLICDACGDLRRAYQVTEADPSVARWLPALEWWDWQRADEACADRPWLLYTEGLNRGGIGGDNTNALQTRVYLTRLATSEVE